jgi:hypothetical protein
VSWQRCRSNRNRLAVVSLAPGIPLQSSTASFAAEPLMVGGGRIAGAPRQPWRW